MKPLLELLKATHATSAGLKAFCTYVDGRGRTALSYLGVLMRHTGPIAVRLCAPPPVG